MQLDPWNKKTLGWSTEGSSAVHVLYSRRAPRMDMWEHCWPFLSCRCSFHRNIHIDSSQQQCSSIQDTVSASSSSCCWPLLQDFWELALAEVPQGASCSQADLGFLTLCSAASLLACSWSDLVWERKQHTGDTQIHTPAWHTHSTPQNIQVLSP